MAHSLLFFFGVTGMLQFGAISSPFKQTVDDVVTEECERIDVKNVRKLSEEFVVVLPYAQF